MGIKHSDVKASGEKGFATEWNKNHVIDGNIDMLQNQLLNNVIENRTDFPAGPVEGQAIYRTDLNVLYVYDGAAWTDYLSKETGQAVEEAEDDHTVPLATFTQMDSMNVVHNSKTGKVLVMFSANIWPGFNNLAEIKLQKNGVDVTGGLREAYYLGAGESGAGTCAIQTIDTGTGNNTWRIMWRVSVGADDLIAYHRTLSVIDL